MKKKVSVLLLLLIIYLGFYSYNMLKYGNFKFFRVEQEYENVNRPNSQTDALSRNPYLVYDRNQGKVLEENNADEVFSTASLAKLFTVLYTLENVDMDFKVRVGDEIYLAGQNSSLAGITEGVYTIRDLIKAAIVPSGNDAAYALAKATLD